eukprot:gnl/MRDRNA2_/MRDRNA2_109311_c0_seq1.p1 gnl/MRDRNA2_/MRDRNA2_109311_c0~~gnl/MRDRNA2_/MRDRNA2_109311_c0_seq1.p1  ORF type:complete len:180 (+),score=26.38 gnl/MRDRNA2_/MRDRNA2_109311_c0_seq1:90-629(+)
MVIPLPFSMPTQHGPPTEYAMKCRTGLMVLLTLQSVVVAVRIYPLLDIMGGFMVAIVIGLGWYAAYNDMNIQFLCYYGLMSLINGVFDLVKFIDVAVKATVLFSSSMPIIHNLAIGVLLFGPLLELVAAVLVWVIYKDYSLCAGGAQYLPISQHDSSSGSSEPARFSPFQGTGSRLGSA